jgi:(1->4)-alpha-D-glucan 1-alpha-D-glucosylmutase
MLSSSTHDSKRSEDVRARVDVLSEIPAEWRLRLRSWQQWNREKKRAIEGRAAPAQNDEYLLYQTLVGTWPSHICDEAAWSKFSERIEQYMLKAAREAKEHTNWTNPNPEYEAALTEFTRAVLERNPQNLFFKDFSEFHRRIARCGSFNSLSQCLLKLTSPGVPDIYQGNELWELSLADPDNRRPVNYAERKEQLVEQLRLDGQPSQALREYVRGLVTNLDDGRCKLFVTSKTLRTRRAETALFQRGTYAPLTVSGSRAAHIVAFAREYEGRIAVVAAPRLTATLLSENFESPCEPEVWADTSVEVKSRHVACYHNVFTGECTPLSGNQPQHSLQARELFRYFPVALLLGNP